jgi:hypothetical protein
MTDHQTGTREEWLAARLELLEEDIGRESIECTVSGKCRGIVMAQSPLCWYPSSTLFICTE